MEEAKDKKTLFNFIIQFLIVIIIVGLISEFSIRAWDDLKLRSAEPTTKGSLESVEFEFKGELLVNTIILTIIVLISYKIASYNKKQILLKKAFYIFMSIIYIIILLLIMRNSFNYINYLKNDSKISENEKLFPTSSMDIKIDELKIKYQYLKIGVAPVSYIFMNAVFYIDKRRVLKKNKSA